MSDFTSYVEEQVRDWMSQSSDTVAAPSELYVGLHTGDPTNDGDANEVSASDYSRASTTAGSDWDSTGTGGPYGFENAVEVSFDQAESNWGEISHVSLWDGPDGTDNALAAYALDSSRDIGDGDEGKFNPGNLTFDID